MSFYNTSVCTSTWVRTVCAPDLRFWYHRVKDCQSSALKMWLLKKYLNTSESKSHCECHIIIYHHITIFFLFFLFQYRYGDSFFYKPNNDLKNLQSKNQKGKSSWNALFSWWTDEWFFIQFAKCWIDSNGSNCTYCWNYSWSCRIIIVE